MNKSVWYCHHYAGTPEKGMSYRPYYLAQALKEKDVDVTVFSAVFHHLLKDPFLLKGDSYIKTSEAGVNYVWVKTPAYEGNGFSRLKNTFSYSRFFKKTSLVEAQIVPKPDTIIVSSPHPFHFKPLLKVARRFNAKLIFEVRDLWPLSLAHLLGVPKMHPMMIYLSYLEKFAYKHSDAVVSLLPNASAYMKKKGMRPHKFNYIPNGICENKAISTKVPELIISLKQQGKFIVLYTGAHGIPNALGQLIDTAIKIQNNERIHFILIGEGSEKKRLVEIASKNNLKNITFLDSVPKSKAEEFQRNSDVCYLGWQKCDLYKYGISANKLFDYMLAGRPVIQSIDSPGNPIEVSGAGSCIEPMNSEVLVKKVIEFSLESEDKLFEMGQKGRQYVIENHSYNILAESYAKLLH